jgi:nucleoside-diphosphate-sugar epimerase
VPDSRAPGSRRILIAGCGYVGIALGVRLADGGDRVVGLRRDPSKLPRTIEGIAADFSDPTSLSDLAGPFDVVFYTAGASEFSDAAYRAAYVDGLRNLLDAVERGGGTGRVVFTSSTGVYAQTDGEWVDETSPTEPTTFSGQRVLEGERLLAASRDAAISLRLGGIYGPGRTGLIDRVRRGEARREAGRSRYLNLIHLEDIVGTLIHVAGLESPDRVYIGVDDQPQEYNTLLEWTAQELGVPVPPSTDAPQTRGRPARNRRCSNRRLRESGYSFIYPNARAGYRELIGEEGPS